MADCDLVVLPCGQWTGGHSTPIVAEAPSHGDRTLTDKTNRLTYPIPGLDACGGMVGGLFHSNYPGGTGLMAGAVFGRIASASAAGE